MIRSPCEFAFHRTCFFIHNCSAVLSYCRPYRWRTVLNKTTLTSGSDIVTLRRFPRPPHIWSFASRTHRIQESTVLWLQFYYKGHKLWPAKWRHTEGRGLTCRASVPSQWGLRRHHLLGTLLCSPTRKLTPALGAQSRLFTGVSWWGHDWLHNGSHDWTQSAVLLPSLKIRLILPESKPQPSHPWVVFPSGVILLP